MKCDNSFTVGFGVLVLVDCGVPAVTDEFSDHNQKSQQMSELYNFHTTISSTWINIILLSIGSYHILVDLILVGTAVFIHSFFISENFNFLLSSFLVYELLEVRVSRPLLHKKPPWPNYSCKRDYLIYWQLQFNQQASFLQFPIISKLGNNYSWTFLNPESNLNSYLLWNTIFNRLRQLKFIIQRRIYLFHNSLHKAKPYSRGICKAFITKILECFLCSFSPSKPDFNRYHSFTQHILSTPRLVQPGTFTIIVKLIGIFDIHNLARVINFSKPLSEITFKLNSQTSRWTFLFGYSAERKHFTSSIESILRNLGI